MIDRDINYIVHMIGGFDVLCRAEKVTAYFAGKSYIIKSRDANCPPDNSIPHGYPNKVVVEFV